MSVAMPYADFVFGNESEATTYGEVKVGQSINIYPWIHRGLALAKLRWSRRLRFSHCQYMKWPPSCVTF